MDIFEKIDNATKNDPDDKILNFYGYKIHELIGKGEQGRVYKIINKILKTFALKLHKPTTMDPTIISQSLSNFKREIHILASLYHKNVVKIITGGSAAWDASTTLWKVTEGFDESAVDEAVFFNIMDFVDGENISSLFQPTKTPPTLNEQLYLFEELIVQVSNAMFYYHSKEVTHRDIKSDNIRFSKEDSTFVVVDFGFARHHKSPLPDTDVIRKTPYIDLPSIYSKDFIKNDIANFCYLLKKILPAFRTLYDTDRYKGIERCLNKALIPELEDRYSDAKDFYDSIKNYFIALPGWKLILRKNEYLLPNLFGKFQQRIRIPVSGSLLLTNEMKEIIDSADFQRLRGVRQLGPTIFVYPGANNTRFEHSLGTFNYAIRYLDKLLTVPHFREISFPVDHTIKMIVLSSLLHDIGHYPYSHWIEEIDDFHDGGKLLPHEERAKRIIQNGPLGKILESKWDIRVNDLCDIISSRRIRAKGIKALVNSFIDSIIDVDKIDYLTRDAVHCGIKYGEVIDIERLMESVYVDPSTNTLCVTDKGTSVLFAILVCRNIMYHEVYWHKTVRVCDAMFKRFFYECVRLDMVRFEDLDDLFMFSDDHFISKLYYKSTSNKKYKGLTKLIYPFAFEGRSLYKPAFIFSRSNPAGEDIDVVKFFKKIFLANYSDLIKISDYLLQCLKLQIPELKPYDILIEKTPTKDEHSKYSMDGFRIWNRRKMKFEKYPNELGHLNEYLNNNVQGYIFCNPDHYDKIRRIVLSENFSCILGDCLDYKGTVRDVEVETENQ